MRKLRELMKNASYHVYAKINRDEMSFETDDIKELFMNVIVEAKKKYDFSLRNYCIMGNHIHFDITPAETISLSKIMQWILSVFAMRYNRIRGIKGHVWYDRFKSKIIHDYLQLVNTFHYISSNPVKAKITKHPLEYRYCGLYQIFRGRFDIIDKPDRWLEEQIKIYLDNFSVDSESLRAF